MHELAVTQNILEIAERHARAANAARVTDLYLVVGRLSSVVDDSVQFYWDVISEGTLCEGAQLHFERIPAGLHCLDCEHEYTLNGELEACPHCGGFRVHVVRGEEFRLDSIEVEEVPGQGDGVTR